MAKSTPATFEKQLKQALKHYAKPDRLAADSLLATAYFLGDAGDAAADAGPAHWGELLRQALLRAAHTLWGDAPPRSREEIEDAWGEILAEPGTPRYSYLVLELRYFRQFFRPRSLQQIWEEFLQQSRAEFYRDVDRAIDELGAALLRSLRPGVRLETPPTAGPLVGRATLLRRIETALHNGQSVGLSGASGSGKTSLAAAVAQQWPTAAVFWFTVRPELTDRLYQLLYALGAFLQRHGATALWRALVANQGRMDDPALLYSLARRDLETLADVQPLLILDEADRWSADDGAERQIDQFLNGLQAAVPILAAGQRLELATAQRITLEDLSVSDTAALLETAGLALPAADIQRLQRETHGNPRLVWLCVDLLRQGETLDNILTGETGPAQAFTNYLNLLWPRLDPAERSLAQALAVFTHPAPRDPWPAEALDGLHARHLLTYDRTGGVRLLPGVRRAVLRALSAEQREALHQQAAALFAARAEYTLAAFHFRHGAQPQNAVRIWYPRREQEIARGQAATAAAIFHNLSGAQLSKTDRQTLAVIRADLHRLTGNLQAGLDALRAEESSQSDANPLLLDAQRLRGDFLDGLGAPEDALAAYGAGLETITRLQQRTVDLHVRRSMVHVRQRRLIDAWEAAQQARLQAEQLQGLIREEQGNLEAAEAHYQAALEIATVIDDSRGLAESNRCLCNVYGRRGQLEQAQAYAGAAIEHYERIGDLVNGALVRSNLAAAYLDAGEFLRVLDVGRPAFEFFRQHGYAHRLAGTACNLAEAHFELGEQAEAERYAQLALQQEEPVAVPYALYTLALVRHAKRETDAGLTLLSQCREAAQRNEDIFIEAYACFKTAEVLSETADHSPDARVEAGQRAVALFQRLGMQEMAEEAARLVEAPVGEREAKT